MGDKLERIFEFRVLYSKLRDLRVPLTLVEKQRLRRLKQDLADYVPSVNERDALTMLAAPLVAKYVVNGRFGAGTLRNASALGLAVETGDEPPELGRRLMLHLHDLGYGTEYTFPCRVVARVVKAPASIGLRFEGMPSKTRSAEASRPIWRADAFPPEEHSSVTRLPS
ncbi:MAG: PilZ domain-containing protein [Polyangiales bacterium]